MKYLSWNQKTIDDYSFANINAQYEKGYVMTRISKGLMSETRSLRVPLNDFKLSSENRRILNKIQDLKLTTIDLPHPDYHFSIGKVAKDFYENRFGPNIMSAQKVKEMLTDINKSNFNTLLTYSRDNTVLGYAIALKTDKILHYSYPFYDLKSPKDMGLCMMLNAIIYAKELGLEYVYLGSLQRKSDSYKLQFSHIEWWNNKEWSSDINSVKEILKNIDNE